MQSVLEGIARRVSVPLRGKGRDQRKDKTSQALRPLAFPSPCGEKVGINYYWNYSQNRWVRFPSPCGEKVGINCPTISTPSGLSSRFRPLAGKR